MDGGVLAVTVGHEDIPKKEELEGAPINVPPRLREMFKLSRAKQQILRIIVPDEEFPELRDMPMRLYPYIINSTDPPDSGTWDLRFGPRYTARVEVVWDRDTLTVRDDVSAGPFRDPTTEEVDYMQGLFDYLGGARR